MTKRLAKYEQLSPEQVNSRQLILIISLIGFIATTILTIVSILEKNALEIIINSGTAILLLISLIMAWSGSIGFGRAALPLSALISITYLAAVGNGIHDPGMLAFAIVIAIATLLLGRRGIIIYGALSIIAILAIIYVGSTGLVQHPQTGIPDIIAVMMAIIVSTIILYLNARQLEKSINDLRKNEQAQKEANQELIETRNSLENQTNELVIANEQSKHRYERLRLVAEVAKSSASIQELERLLTAITTLISQRFGIYHTGIFLLNNNHEYAILRAANSEGGQKMLEQKHRLRVGAQGIVGSVTATGDPRIALDVGLDAVYFNNPYLPDTHSEIALPLKITGEIIGALDLQSVEPNAFSQEDVEVLSILADQLATAIQNARSFEAARYAVQEAERASQQLTGQAWKQFFEKQQIQGYHFDGIETKSISKIPTKPTDSALQISVQLRGQEIGKLELNTLEPDRNWNTEEIEVVKATAERAALALESARLLEDAQQRASRERIIGDISTSISTFSDMEGILRTAVQQLGRRMGGAEVVLELGSDLEKD
jgi:GAF domain-containing protein